MYLSLFLKPYLFFVVSRYISVCIALTTLKSADGTDCATYAVLFFFFWATFLIVNTITLYEGERCKFKQ